jgi:hypothetical protein
MKTRLLKKPVKYTCEEKIVEVRTGNIKAFFLLSYTAPHLELAFASKVILLLVLQSSGCHRYYLLEEDTVSYGKQNQTANLNLFF